MDNVSGAVAVKHALQAPEVLGVSPPGVARDL